MTNVTGAIVGCRFVATEDNLASFKLSVIAPRKDEEAVKAGFEPLTLESTNWDHKVYYPDAHELHLRVTGDRRTGRLLGAQIVGHWRGEVAKRIDVFATALFHGMCVEDLNDLDLSYTPPVSSPWDPVQMSAQAWMRHLA